MDSSSSNLYQGVVCLGNVDQQLLNPIYALIIIRNLSWVCHTFPYLDVVLDLVDGGHFVQLDSVKAHDRLDCIPEHLCVLVRHAYSACPSDVPPGLRAQVLGHDRGEDNHLRVPVIEDLPVAKVQAVRDVFRHPREVLVRIEEPYGVGRVPRVDLVVPLHGSREVGLVALPVFACGRVVLVLRSLEGADGEDCLDWFTDADDRDGLDEGLAQAPYEGLSSIGGAVLRLGAKVEVELGSGFGVRAGNDARHGYHIPALCSHLCAAHICLDFLEELRELWV